MYMLYQQVVRLSWKHIDLDNARWDMDYRDWPAWDTRHHCQRGDFITFVDGLFLMTGFTRELDAKHGYWLNNLNTNLLREYCNPMGVPWDLVSLSNVVSIRFKSNSQGQATGFHLQYSEEDPVFLPAWFHDEGMDEIFS